MSWAMVAVAVAVVSGAVSQRSQRKQATMQRDQQQAIYDIETEQTERDNRANTSAMEQAMEDEKQAEFLETLENDRKALRDVGTTVAQTANTGVAGITAERNIDNALFQNQLNENVIKANTEAQLFNIANTGFRSQQDVIKRKANANVPSVLSSTLKVGASAVGTYASMQPRSKK